VKASARGVASCERGRTALSVLKGEAPLLPRRTGPNEVHFVGGAAGPLGGDELSIELEVGPGATLWVRTVAASIALPGRDGAWSTLSISATVGAGGRLVWLPEPLVAAARCRHHSLCSVDLEEGASLIWREEVVFGRHNELPGDVRLSTVVRRANRPMYLSDLAIGPSYPDGPAILGGARVHATLISTGTSGMVPTPRAAVMALANGGVVATALGDDLAETRAVTDRLVTPPQQSSKAQETAGASTSIDSPDW
jgi:urease accessory protein